MEGDPKINSKIWLRKKRELIAMASEGGTNLEKKIVDLSIMFHKNASTISTFSRAKIQEN